MDAGVSHEFDWHVRSAGCVRIARSFPTGSAYGDLLGMELADAPINLFVPIGFAVAVSAFTASRLGEPLAALRLSKSAEKKVIKANAR